MRLGLGSLLLGARGVTAGGPPVIIGVDHDVVDISGGGQPVVVQVDSSTGCTGITIGGVACTSFTVVDATHVSGIPGAHAAGVVDVVVTNGAGPSTTGTGLVEYWSPKQLATGSKDTFLDANKGITFGTGAKVSQWDSQGDTARAFTNGTGSYQPEQIPNVFGSLPAVRFDGTDDSLSVSTTGPLSGFSVFAVAKWTSSDATASQPSWNPPLTILGYTGGWAGFGASAGSIAYLKYDRTPVETRGTSLNDDVARLIGITGNGTPDMKFYVGETQQGATWSPGGVSTLYYSRVGGGYSGDYFAGDLGALLAVEGVISAANLTRLHSWAQQRFNVA